MTRLRAGCDGNDVMWGDEGKLNDDDACVFKAHDIWRTMQRNSEIRIHKWHVLCVQAPQQF